MTGALIMSGGRSERMRAGGCATHKALRIVGEQCLMEKNLLKVGEAGFKKIWVAVSSHEAEVVSWLADTGQRIATSMAVELRVLVERTPLGTIGAAGLVPPEITDLLVFNVDNLSTVDLRDLGEAHARTQACMTVAVHQEWFQIPFGQVLSSNDYLDTYIEKPRLPVTISSGIYMLRRRARQFLQPATQMDVPALVQSLRDAGERVFCYRHNSSWIDINDEEALARANATYHSLAAVAR